MKRFSVVAAVVMMLVVPRGGFALDASASTRASCTPDCSGVASGDAVPDPMDCTKYYLCFNGEPGDHSNSCGSNSHFDPSTLQCVTGAACDSVCGDGGTGCPITCDGTSEVVANPFNCSTYYICNPTRPVLVACTPNFPYFDGTGCTYDDSVCCPPYCGVDCDGTGFEMVPDPDDCSSFYACEPGVTGDPGSSYHFSCGAGEYFNIALGNCEAGDARDCTTLCDAAMGGGRGARRH